jgi:hypothetical protein
LRPWGDMSQDRKIAREVYLFDIDEQEALCRT